MQGCFFHFPIKSHQSAGFRPFGVMFFPFLAIFPGLIIPNPIFRRFWYDCFPGFLSQSVQNGLIGMILCSLGSDRLLYTEIHLRRQNLRNPQKPQKPRNRAVFANRSDRRQHSIRLPTPLSYQQEYRQAFRPLPRFCPFQRLRQDMPSGIRQFRWGCLP